MRTYYLAALSVLALFLAMCSGCDERSEPDSGLRFVSCTITNNPQVPGYYLFAVIVAQDGRTAQEVEILNADVPIRMIDYFDRSMNDLHVGAVGEYRVMRAYDSDAEGHTLDNNSWCQLESNESGSFTAINADRLNQQSTPQGRAVRSKPQAVNWTIDARPDGVMVTIDGAQYWTAR